MDFVLTLLLGVVVGVLANFSYQWITSAIARLFGRISLKGLWAERIVEGTHRLHSLGEIRYDMRQRMWVFDGTNYHNDGSPFCHWRTVASYVDRQAKRFYYVFLNTHVDSTHARYTGFGFVDLEYRDKSWVPRNGAFAAGNPGEAFRSHSMVRIDALPLDRQGRLSLFATLEPDGQDVPHLLGKTSSNQAKPTKGHASFLPASQVPK